MNSCCGFTGQSTWRAACPRCTPTTSCSKQDVGGEAVQPIAQLVDHHPAIELREPLVDVVGRDGEAHGRIELGNPRC
jgi:hypothetical protein